MYLFIFYYNSIKQHQILKNCDFFSSNSVFKQYAWNLLLRFVFKTPFWLTFSIFPWEYELSEQACGEC